MSKIVKVNQSAASISTPAPGETVVFVDSVTKKLQSKDDAGLVTDYAAASSGISSLTGEVTATGPGAAAATVTNSAVISKVLTGLSPTTGTISATDTILQAMNKLANRSESSWFGLASDGIVTISSNTTLVRDMYYQSLTINPSVILSTNGYRIFSVDSIVNNGTIDRSGNNAIANAGGVALAVGTIGLGTAGGAGGGVGAGTAGTNVATSLGGTAGSGGTGAAGAAGNAGVTILLTAVQGGLEAMQSIRMAQVAQTLGTTPTIINGGAGGGGGGGGGVAASGGGGGGGAGVIVISTRSLTGSGLICACGGNGASAPGVNGGGGGAGGGGVIITITENDVTATGLTLSVAPGTVGSGNGTGLSGNAGTVGRIYRLRT